MRAVLDIVTHTLAVALAMLISWQLFVIAGRYRESGQFTQSLGWVIWPDAYVMAFASLFLVTSLILQVAANIRVLDLRRAQGRDARAGRDREHPVSATLATLLVFAGMFAFLLAGMPLGFAMVAAGFVGCLFFIDFGAGLSLLGQATYESARSADFALIPLFMLMGSFASRAGLSEDMFTAFNAWLGQRRGGLALATIGACGAFAAVCGSSVATAATMTHVALPAMQRHGYSSTLVHRRDRGRRHARHPDPAEHRHGGLRADHRDQRRRPVPRRASSRAS